MALKVNGQERLCFLCLNKASAVKIPVCGDCMSSLCSYHDKKDAKSLANQDSKECHPGTVDVLCMHRDFDKTAFHFFSCKGAACRYCVALNLSEDAFHRESNQNTANRLSDDDRIKTTAHRLSSLTLVKEQRQLNKIRPSNFQTEAPFGLLDNSNPKPRQRTDLESAIDEVNQSIEITRQMIYRTPSLSDTFGSITMVTPDVVPTARNYVNHVEKYDPSVPPLGDVEDNTVNMAESDKCDVTKCLIPEMFTIHHVTSLGTQGELEEPVGVATTPDGSIFVADHAYDRILVFDKRGQLSRTMTHVSTGTGRESGFLCPAGVATDVSGNVVVAERARHRITVMSPCGKLHHKFGKMGKAHGQFRDPLGVSCDSRGRRIVADTANSRIQVFDKHGDFIFSFGRTGDHALDYPNYAIYHQGLFIVSDTDNDSVKVFDKEGRYLRPLTDHDEGLFSAPSGLAIFKHSYLLVCDFNNDFVKVFTLGGKFVTKFGGEGSGPGQFSGPEAIAVTSDNRIIVTDKNNSRVQVFGYGNA